MTATITNHLGQSLTGEVRCWMGRRIVEVETPDGARHIGRLRRDPQPAPRADAAGCHCGRDGGGVMLTITDLFCGAGGSGLGAQAAGYQLVMAANHWRRAIDTHAANFPDTEHDCADISQVNPRRYRTTDVLWASPECTNHSQAKGRRRTLDQPDMFGDTLPDEAAERSRATMYDVPRFAEQHRYRAIVVENVVEVVKWVGFRGWLVTMDDHGYDHEIVCLNSMHAPAMAAPRAPQSRDRVYVVCGARASPARTSHRDRWPGAPSAAMRARRGRRGRTAAP